MCNSALHDRFSTPVFSSDDIWQKDHSVEFSTTTRQAILVVRDPLWLTRISPSARKRAAVSDRSAAPTGSEWDVPSCCQRRQWREGSKGFPTSLSRCVDYRSVTVRSKRPSSTLPNESYFPLDLPPARCPRFGAGVVLGTCPCGLPLPPV